MQISAVGLSVEALSARKEDCLQDAVEKWR